MNAFRRRPRLLGADTISGIATLQNVFGDTFEIVGEHSLDGALRRLGEKWEVVICGLHFDESRMFDLLRFAKATPATRDTPFICYRDLNTDLGRSILEGMQIAAKAHGAAAFVDMFTLRRESGTDRADERFREIVFSHLPRP